MDLSLGREFGLLLGVWALFLGVFLVFLRGAAQEESWVEAPWKKRAVLESSVAGSPLEKRLYQRRRLPFTIRYSVLERPIFQGTTLSKDISKGGVCIPLPASLQRGSRLHLSIQLPKARRPLSVWGEVVWQTSRFSDPSGRFETGIRFVELDPSKILTIARFL